MVSILKSRSMTLTLKVILKCGCYQKCIRDVVNWLREDLLNCIESQRFVKFDT